MSLSRTEEEVLQLQRHYARDIPVPRPGEAAPRSTLCTQLPVPGAPAPLGGVLRSGEEWSAQVLTPAVVGWSPGLPHTSLGLRHLEGLPLVLGSSQSGNTGNTGPGTGGPGGQHLGAAWRPQMGRPSAVETATLAPNKELDPEVGVGQRLLSWAPAGEGLGPAPTNPGSRVRAAPGSRLGRAVPPLHTGDSGSLFPK